MRQQLEEELERVMRSAGESAPRPDPNLVELIDERGRRRRRTRLRTAVVCGTAAVAISVVAVAVDLIRRPETLAPASGDTTATKPEKPVEKKKPTQGSASDIPLAEDVWPEAVHQIPGKLPDGRELFPRTFLDANTILMTTESSFEKSNALYKYDLKTHAAKEIATIDSPGYANNFAVGDGWVVWSAFAENSKTRETEIWGVPLAGGQARKLVVAPGRGVDFLAVAGGEVHWSYGGTKSPVYSASLSGDGQAKAIPGSKGYHIVSWPWIGSPGEQIEGRTNPQDEQRILYRTLRNAETGETRTTTDLKGSWSCGVNWCVGTSNGKGYAARRDGSGRKSLEGIGIPYDMAAVPLPIHDRFYAYGTTIVDTHTGKIARLENIEEGFRIPNDGRLHFNYIKNGYELIDFAAIE